MKFLHKINRIYFISFIIALFTLSILGYFTLRILLIEEAKEKLAEKEHIIIEHIKIDSILPNFYPFIEVVQNPKSIERNAIFKTIYLENLIEDNELEPYLEYSSNTKVNNINHSIKIRQPLVESKELLMTIALSLLAIFLLILLSVFIININLTKRIWSKFENNLLTVSEFNFNDKDKLQLKPTGIMEFDNLNKIILSLTNKLRTDYIAIKEFADNASHEMQSPLAVITMNLETLLQEKLPESIAEKVYISYQYTNKLHKLNKSLLLLTKIGNNQFNDVQRLNMSTLINQKLIDFLPLTEAMNLKIKSNLKQEYVVTIDPTLAEILINNLLSNAINHNIEGGFISISIDAKKIFISNSTDDVVLEEEELFNRFKKGQANSDSVGLGLAIVKKIIDLYNLNINLKHSANIMMVTISM